MRFLAVAHIYEGRTCLAYPPSLSPGFWRTTAPYALPRVGCVDGRYELQDSGLLSTTVTRVPLRTPIPNTCRSLPRLTHTFAYSYPTRARAFWRLPLGLGCLVLQFAAYPTGCCSATRTPLPHLPTHAATATHDARYAYHTHAPSWRHLTAAAARTPRLRAPLRAGSARDLPATTAHTCCLFTATAPSAFTLPCYACYAFTFSSAIRSLPLYVVTLFFYHTACRTYSCTHAARTLPRTTAVGFGVTLWTGRPLLPQPGDQRLAIYSRCYRI